MGVYNVPVVFDIDEEKIAENIEKDYERIAKNIIEKKIDNAIRARYSYWDKDPFKEMVGDSIKNILAEHTDEIVKGATEILADKLSRQKAVKEIAAKVAIDILEG